MQMITQLKIKKELIIMLNSILLILAAVIPAVLLLVKVYRTDKLEPESPRLLAGLIIAGILSAILAIFEESVLTYVLDMVLYNGSLLYKLILFYLIVAGSEESSKYLLMKWRTWKNPEFDCRFDGVIYAVFTSLGFALLENIFYVFDQGFETALIRAFTAIPGHACFGIFMGIFYAIAKEYDYMGNKSQSSLYRKLSVLVPALIHGTYDFIATMQNMASVILFFIFIGAVFYIANKLINKMAQQDHYMTWHTF